MSWPKRDTQERVRGSGKRREGRKQKVRRRGGTQERERGKLRLRMSNGDWGQEGYCNEWKNKIPTPKNLKDAGDNDSLKVSQWSRWRMQHCRRIYNQCSLTSRVQANVEVCKVDPQTQAQSIMFNPIILNPEIDLNSKAGLQNELNSNSDSDWLPNVTLPDPKPTGAKPRFLGPPPYTSLPISRNLFNNICQIEIELHSRSLQALGSVPPQVTISEFDSTCQELPGVAAKTSGDSGRTAGVEGEKEESGAPQEIVWDEQGMTWEVYGASLDMESLGFAIQNHLQCKIHEHERRIGTLRKSICLSEQSPGKGRTGKKKRNIFRSLFAGSKCCSKPRPKEEAEKWLILCKCIL